MVEKPRAEEYRTVRSIGHNKAINSLLFQKCYDPRLVGVVILDLPAVGRRRTADDQATAFGREIGRRRRDPEIDADGGGVGVHVDGGLRPQTLEGPGLRQRVLAKNIRERAPQLI